MKKVYVITSGEYSDYNIECIFTSLKKAKKYCEIKNKTNYNGYRVENFILNDMSIPVVKKGWEVRIALRNLSWENVTKGQLFRIKECFKETPYETIKKYNEQIIVFSTKSEEHAKKVAIEQYQIYTQNEFENEQMNNRTHEEGLELGKQIFG